MAKHPTVQYTITCSDDRPMQDPILVEREYHESIEKGYEQLLEEFRRHTNEIEKLRKEYSELLNENIDLKIKLGIYGNVSPR